MTRARLNRTLHRLSAREYATAFDSLGITTSDGRKQQFTAAPGLTILCGGNGAGKSTTLGALWRCLSSDLTGPSGLPPVPPWITNLEISGTHANETWMTSYDISSSTFSGSCPVKAYYLDATARTEELIRLMRKDDNPNDLIEGIGASVLERDLIDILSITLRRNYETVDVYEVTSFSEEDEAVPFFAVTAMGHRYDLPAMGRGELAAIYLVWSLSRIEPGAIVLIEEPECHLADYSQRSLLDVLSYFAVERDLTLIVSSHSPGLFRPLPTNHVVLVSTLPLPGFRSGLSTDELSNYLGLEDIGKSALLVVEDNAASAFLGAILDRVDHGLLQHISICYCQNGASGVERVTSELQGHIYPPSFKVLGILDGDMRSSSGVSSPLEVAFLPGEEAPERVMRDALNQWRRVATKSWVPPLAGGTETLELELARSDGLDHHDWLFSISGRYGGIVSFVRTVTGLILEDQALLSQAQELAAWLRGTLQT
jgi:predicted ATPase